MVSYFFHEVNFSVVNFSAVEHLCTIVFVHCEIVYCYSICLSCLSQFNYASLVAALLSSPTRAFYSVEACSASY